VFLKTVSATLALVLLMGLFSGCARAFAPAPVLPAPTPLPTITAPDYFTATSLC